jgi:hypothetical protein
MKRPSHGAARTPRTRISSGSRVLLALFGLAVGLGLAELGLHVHADRRLTAPFRTPPGYQHGPSRIRLAVLGGSTSLGMPYNEARQEVLKLEPLRAGPEAIPPFNLLSFTQLVLERTYGSSEVEATVLARGGWSLEWAMRCYWRYVKHKPDVLVLYTGQNEWVCYYTSAMRPPPRALSFLGHLNTGSRLLRRQFLSSARPGEDNSDGPFLLEADLPWYEAAYNRKRFRTCVETLIRHCRQSDIFLIIVIPETNYLWPPSRSVYAGPAGRRAEAAERFRTALYHKYCRHDLEQAEAVLKRIAGFCEFANLHYELGHIHYLRGEFDEARTRLLAARDTAATPHSITSEYRELLRERARAHGVAWIDMHPLVTEAVGAEVPDFTAFVDDCHLTPRIYTLLTKEILRTLAKRGPARLGLDPSGPLPASTDWLQVVGLTEAVVNLARVEANGGLGLKEVWHSRLKVPRLWAAVEHAPGPFAAGTEEQRRGTEYLRQMRTLLEREKAKLAGAVRGAGRTGR